MMMRIPVPVLALMLVGTPVASQAGADVTAPSAASATTLMPPALDPRLAITIDVPDGQPEASRAWQDVTRPRWRYPAIGAAVGVAAGLIHGHVIMQGEPIGIPVDARYILAPAYGLAGAFIGLLIDSSERERAARR